MPRQLDWMGPWPAGRATVGLHVLTLQSILAIANKPEPPKPITWGIHKIAVESVRLGEVEALDEEALIQKAPNYAVTQP